LFLHAVQIARTPGGEEIENGPAADVDVGVEQACVE
jgi:hypothetical protein